MISILLINCDCIYNKLLNYSIKQIFFELSLDFYSFNGTAPDLYVNDGRGPSDDSRASLKGIEVYRGIQSAGLRLHGGYQGPAYQPLFQGTKDIF